MKTAPTVCVRCGVEIPADAPERCCPGCLLERGLGLTRNASVAGVGDRGPDNGVPVADAKKAAGSAQILCDFGDYDLLEEVGRGGQGVVFRARQKSLNRTVALKVISLGQWASDAHLKRFRREAESAASLDHQSIVPIYEVGERDGQCYFSMKFMEGGQLDEVVRHAPVSIRQAAELIAKVARTVHYAHEHGILHRDIKPGNILLDQKGEPHLTDFGLARLLETESTVTRTLEVLGTPSYMAPEQAAGKNSQLTAATDVYGLGAVLYQLLTGHPPFAGGTTYETIKLLLDTEPRPPRALNPKINRELSTICLKCLEKDPKRRYSSALALAEDLEHWLKHEPIKAKPSGVFTHTRKWVRRNPSTTVLVTLLVALAAGLSVVVWNHKPAVIIPKSVAVLPFENLSDDPNNAYFAEGIQEEVLTRLAGIADLKVISRASTQQYQNKPRNLAEIAKQLGVANIVEGSVQKAADQVRVNVQLVNAQTNSHLWADTYDRKLTDIFNVQSEIAKGIAAALQAKLSGREEQSLAAKPTNNPEAYDAYLRGLAFEARDYSASFSRDLLERTADSYERAVQLDPNFAIAWARLSRADAHLYFSGGFDPASAARGEAAKRALENVQKLEPDSPWTLLALGYYQFWVLRDYGAAKITFGRVGRVLPGSSDVQRALALVTRREGHWDESIAYFEQALDLDPRNVELLQDAAETYDMARRFQAALKLYDRVLDITPDDLDTMALKALVYQAQGNLQEAARLLSGVNEKTPSGRAFSTKIAQLLLERRLGEAVQLYQARLAQLHYSSDYAKANDQVVLASMQRLAGDTAGAKVTAEQARNTLEPLYKDQSDNVGGRVITRSLRQAADFAALLSNAYAAMGEKGSALKLAEHAIMLLPRAKDPVIGPSYEENLAIIQVIAGESSGAISTLTQLLQTPYAGWVYGPPPVTSALLRLDPLWDPLRDDPAFQKLCEEKIDKSIAVLPFENLSRDSDNAYFAEGIQDEILTRLAKIADLKIISRTSTQRYPSKPDDLCEIAKQLGVANVLEGSVQKAADQVRVNVQLINAQTDSHLWADSYDRKFTDIFGVESEIAKRVAESLQAKLTGQEEQVITAKPTNNPEAYRFYLQASQIPQHPDALLEDYKAGEQLYVKAIALDPDFALAHARLASVYAGIFYYYDPTDRWKTKARTEAQIAVRLQPNLAEAHFALGKCIYWIDQDYERALEQLDIASRLAPNNGDIGGLIAAIRRRQGKWEQSLEAFERVAGIDPQNPKSLRELVFTLASMRRWPEASRWAAQLRTTAPASLVAKIQSCYVDFWWKGDTRQLRSLLNQVPAEIDPDGSVTSGKWDVAMINRDFAAARTALQMSGVNDISYTKWGATPKSFLRGCIELAEGKQAEAQRLFELARPNFEKAVEEAPLNADCHANLGWFYAFAGRKDEAIREGRRAVELKPESKDAVDGAIMNCYLALIYARVGEKDLAIPLIKRLLKASAAVDSTNYSITVNDLKYRWEWDPLRSDPAFQKLCEEKQP